jgi:hypothetical protein
MRRRLSTLAWMMPLLAGSFVSRGAAAAPARETPAQAPGRSAPHVREKTMGKRRNASGPVAKASPAPVSAPAPAGQAPAPTSESAPSAGRKRGPAKHRKGEVAPPPRDCGPEIAVDRGPGTDPIRIRLLGCDGQPDETARRRLSVVARLRGAPAPAFVDGALVPAPGPPPRPGEASRGVKLVDAGLLSRLSTILEHFGATSMSVVSGYRPQSEGSLHQHARALDVRIAGVDNKTVVAFCRTLPDTGCGYYPNSSFVHVDVRQKGTGNVSWIDASGPGQPARYVSQWPPPVTDAPATAATPAKHEPQEPPPAPANAEPPADEPLLLPLSSAPPASAASAAPLGTW